MKSIQTKSLTNSIFAIAASILVLVFFSSCVKKISFQNFPVVPSAGGDVKVKKDNNNHYRIQISLSNLAKSKRLQPSKTTYIVWMEAANNVAKNIGQINSSTDFLSSQLNASFGTVSSIKPAKTFLTAEDDASIHYPGLQVIMTINDF